MNRRRRRFAILMLVALAGWLGSSYAVAYRLTHRRHPPFAESPPSVAWATFESHRFQTDDDEQVGAWYAEGRDPEAPAVLLLHGNGASRRAMLPHAEALAREGFATLAISLRAHGDSTGATNDIGLSAGRDVVAAVDFLERRCPGRPIVVLGVSLGAATAAYASADLGDRVHGYILECPYESLRIAVRNRTRAYLPIGLDWMAYQGLLAVSPLVIANIDALEPVRAIRGVPESVPVLILAGEKDVLALPEEAEHLFDAVRDHATLEIFPSAAHTRLSSTDPDRYWGQIFGFLRSLSRRSAPSVR